MTLKARSYSTGSKARKLTNCLESKNYRRNKVLIESMANFEYWETMSSMMHFKLGSRECSLSSGSYCRNLLIRKCPELMIAKNALFFALSLRTDAMDCLFN
jgi:hypothetical protein